MIRGIHPLTGEPRNGKPKGANGHPRPELVKFYTDKSPTRSAMSYDAARVGTDMDAHWAHADSRSADSANSKTVRHRLMRNSRYEEGSNGYYAGTINTHANSVVGTGPSLRMLTGSREFNQLVEREWHAWATSIQLRRKLWCMSHARIQDGEAIAVMVNNPAVPGRVQLDIKLIEAEQCQSDLLPYDDRFYVDGIKFDEHGNPLWYDILPEHPGSNVAFFNQSPLRVPASEVLHWFKMRRPGAHRSTPELTSTLTIGAMARRSREATVTAQEAAASIAALLKATMPPDVGADEVAPLSEFPLPRRGIVTLPMGWDAGQMRSEHPNAGYAELHRNLLSESGAPIGQPYNLVAKDSSTYSFASGKLDTLCYRDEIDIERADCDDMVLNRLFAAWFREWTIVAARRDIPPNHQFDWPSHKVIDAAAEAGAQDTKLKNGTLTLRQCYSDAGKDYEDELAVKAEDMFGEANEETIAKARQIDVLRNTPQPAIQYVAAILGVEVATAPQPEAPGGSVAQPEQKPAEGAAV